MPKKQLKAYVVVSDLHCGCQVGLCPESGVKLDEGGTYLPNDGQLQLWKWWNEFWDDFVPEFTNKQPYGVIVNGDALDGVHHGTTSQISHNLTDQGLIAKQVLEPIVEKCKGEFYMVRGTEAHVGKSAAEEERLARELGAVPNEINQYARNDIWKQIGEHGLVHIAHHIGTTSSQAYESTAVHKELIESFVESARCIERAPDMVVRSHRHRYFETMIATARGRSRGVVTPGWQLKTPFAWRTSAKNQNPQIGGVAIIESSTGELYTRQQVWNVGRTLEV